MKISGVHDFFDQSGRRRVTLLALAFFLPAMTIVILLSALSHRHEHELQMTEIRSFADKALVDRQQFLSRQHADITRDLHFIAGLPGIHDLLLHPEDAATTNHVKKVLIALSDAKSLYKTIRILDASGREMVKVANHPSTGAVALPNSLLSTDEGRNFFTESLKLGTTDVYVSAFERAGESEPGHPAVNVPVLRYGTQITDNYGKVLGVVVVSCFGKSLVRSQMSYGTAPHNRSFLLTSGGFFISGAPDGGDWRFLVHGEEEKGAFARYYPEEWQQIGSRPAGQFVTSKGLFSFRRLYLVEPQAGMGVRSDSDDYWILILHIPAVVLNGLFPSAVSHMSLIVVFGMIFFTGAMSLSIRIERNRRSRKELEILASDLKDKESRFRSLFEGSPEAIFLIDVLSGNFAAVNARACALTGLAENALVGKHYTAVHPKDLEADIRLRFQQQVREARLSGASLPEETVVQHHGGRTIPVEIVSQLIRLDGREVIYGVYRDVSRRKQAESELHAKSLLLETVAGSVPAFVYMKDRQGYYLFANRRLLDRLGLSGPDGIVGKREADFFLPDASETSAADERDVLMHGMSVMNKEEELHFADGSTIPVLTNKIPLLNADDEIEGLVGISMDRTAQKAAEERNRELEGQLRNRQKLEMIGTLSGGIAHDFNNILTPIIGYTEMAMSDLPEAGNAAARLGYVLKAASRAKNIVQHILVFSRKQQTDFMRQRVQPIVWESMEFLKHSMPASVVMDNRIDEFDDMIMCDASQFQQVVMNLCTNGWQAMEQRSGTICVELHRTIVDSVAASRNERLEEGRGYALLKVSDSGTGMSPQVAERIFDPFFTTKGVGKGTGLGLSVVYGIIMEHKGAIQVESIEGKGTTFAVYLPLVSEQEESRELINNAVLERQ